MTIPEGSSRRSATPVSSSGDLLTVEQAADYLNITEHFVRRLIRERRIPFLKVGRLVRLRRTDIDEGRRPVGSSRLLGHDELFGQRAMRAVGLARSSAWRSRSTSRGEVGLDIDPEPVVDAKGLGQSKRGVDRDGVLASHDLADASLRQPGRLGEAVLGDAERLEELGEQDLPGCDRLVGLRHRGTLQW